MNDRADLRATVQQVVDTAADDPDAVTVGKISDLVESAGIEDRYRLARALDHKVAADPSVADETIERVVSLYDSDVTDDQRFATIVIESVAGREPERAVPAIDALADALRSEDPYVRRHAVWALAHLSDHDPELVVPLVPDLDPDDDQSPYLEHEHVILVLRNVAREDFTATVPMLHSLFDLLENADAFVGSERFDEQSQYDDQLLWLDQFKESVEPGTVAAGLLVELSEAAPEAVADYVTDAATVLESVERVTVRRDVVEALATLATTYPSAVRPAIPALAAQLEASDAVLQARAARALGLAFEASPDEVVEATAGSLAGLEPLLRDGSPSVRVAVASLYSCVAEADPERVRPFEDALVACLDAEENTVVASAAIALGHIGSAEAKRALEALLERDLEPAVEGTVRDALDGIDSREVRDSGSSTP
jgi:HEAT repeat protein